MNADTKRKLKEVKDNLEAGNYSSSEAMMQISWHILENHVLGDPEPAGLGLWRITDQTMRPTVLQLLEDLGIK